MVSPEEELARLRARVEGLETTNRHLKDQDLKLYRDARRFREVIKQAEPLVRMGLVIGVTLGKMMPYDVTKALEETNWLDSKAVKRI